METLQDYGLNRDCLYEVLACTISKKNEIEYPNTASMGIRIINDKLLKIKPYYNTITHKNIKESGIVSINFIDNVFLFAQASLKEIKGGFKGIPIEEYLYYNYKYRGKNCNCPYIKDSWMVIFCNVVNETQIVKNDNLGTINATEFELEVNNSFKKKGSFKLYNRAENLALESIILATRLKIARQNKDELLYSKIETRIDEYLKMITRFGKNVSVLKTINLVKDYIKFLK